MASRKAAVIDHVRRAAAAAGVPTELAANLYDMLIEGIQVGSTTAGGGAHAWTLNGVTQANGSKYAIKPGDKILVAVGSELHGLTFLPPSSCGTDATCTEASVRKVFDTSSNSWLELQWVLFSVVFLLCAPWTILANENIRIDIVNNLLPKRLRDSIDVVGHSLFLLPLTIIMMLTGVPFFMRSYEINEQSGNAGGLPQWPSKSLIMIGFTLLMIQGLSELVKRLAVMRDLFPDPHAAQKSSLETEAEEIIAAMEKH